MRTGPRRTVMLALCAAVAACGLFPDLSGLEGADATSGVDAADAGDAAPSEAAANDAANDATGGDAGVEAGCNVAADFGQPVPVTELDVLEDDFGARLTPDLRTVFFSSNRQSAVARIWTATRASATAAFGAPVLVPELADDAGDTRDPWISSDALRLVFGSDRAGGAGNVDVWLAERDASTAAFAAPTDVTIVNSPSNDECPFVGADGTLYFGRASGSTRDLYAAAPAGAVWSAPLAIAELVDPSSNETCPVVSADGLTMYFSSDRGGSYDVFRATRSATTQPWTNVTSLGSLNTTSMEYPSFVSPDGCTLWLTSDRNQGPGSLDIYVAKKP